MNCISLTLYTVTKFFNAKPFYQHVSYFPLPMTRFDEMALIRHLLSQQEAIRLELFCLRLTQRSGSILPKVA